MEISLKHQLLKLARLDHETMENSKFTFDVFCDLIGFQEDYSKRKTFEVTVIDRNDNPVYLDDHFENLEIYRENPEFFEVWN